MVVALALCLLGIGVSVQLTRIHLFVHTDPNYHSVCAVSEGVNCETVAASPYSVFGGLPVSVWGILGYAFMAVTALWAASRRRLHPLWGLGALFGLCLVSVAVSAVLAFISFTRIDSLCLFCMASYGINLCLLVLVVVTAKRRRVGFFDAFAKDVGALVKRPLTAGLCGALGLATVAIPSVAVTPYWRTPGWSDLPEMESGVDEQGHHWIGAREPKLEIVEFSDYECPHCRAAHKSMRMMVAANPKVRLVHRHLPLDMACHPELRRPFHQRACDFAVAAECAGRQGFFWEMNDALFSIQETVKTEDVDPEELAVRLGLNRSDFAACLEDSDSAERVQKDLGAAIEKGLRGTPSFLIDDEVFLGRIPESELAKRLGGVVAPGGATTEATH